ncbi:MAG: succinylglutamate desuccinylase/aspartoacylase family protein [Chloroflexota bacterium]|jgi:predicted deacylase
MSGETIHVGNLTCTPGNKTRGLLEVCGSDLKLPVTIIAGAKPGPTVAITGGTHGGEYPGIETAIRLARSLEPGDVSGCVIIVHPVNITAFYARSQYVVPEDGRNLNRMYPGRARGTFSERIAYTVFNEVMARADFYLDLHGGDIHESLTPFVLYPTACAPEVAEKSRAAAAVMGIPIVLGSLSINGTFGAAAAKGIPGLLAEIGGCGRWNEEEVAQYLRAVHNVLRHLGVLAGPVADLGKPTFYPRMGGVNAEQNGCWYPCVGLGDKVREGDKIGEIRDFFGEKLADYRAPANGVIVYVVTSLAITAGDPLIGMALA